MDSNLYFMTINFYGRCSIFFRFQLSERRWTIKCFAGKILNPHQNTLWLTQNISLFDDFWWACSRTFHICFIMIALWEGFNLLYDIIIRYPNGYVLRLCVYCIVYVCFIIDTIITTTAKTWKEWNSYEEIAMIWTINRQNRNYWLYDGIHIYI